MPASASLTAWILVGGRLTPTAALWQLPPPQLVIAADGGARHAAVLQAHWDMTVEHWVGDFDSSAGVNLQAPREVFPTAKDQTDGELATQLALTRGATQLVFIGAFGGRFDHTAALVLGGLRLARDGLKIILTSGDEWGWPLLPSAPLSLNLPTQTTLSVVACSDLVGLSLSGVRWPLNSASVPLGSGWTVSNEVAPDSGSVPDGRGQVTASVEQGMALVTALV